MGWKVCTKMNFPTKQRVEKGIVVKKNIYIYIYISEMKG
jgi:hypothetical protein